MENTELCDRLKHVRYGAMLYDLIVMGDELCRHYHTHMEKDTYDILYEYVRPEYSDSDDDSSDNPSFPESVTVIKMKD